MSSCRSFYQIMAMICTCSCSRVYRERPIAIKPASHDSVRVSLVDGWLPHRAATVGQYVIEDSSTISADNDSTQTSSINSRTVFTLTTQLVEDSTVLQARIDSLFVSSHTPMVRITFDSSLSQTFKATLSPAGRVQKIDGHPSNFCVGGQNPVVSRILDLTISYPQHRIKDGDKWADTTRITTCRGKTPLRQENTQQYKMLGRIALPTSSAMKIQRITSTRFIGSRANLWNHLEIEGSGTSLMILYVDDVTGFLLSANGKSTSTLNVSTVRGSYSFTQNISTNLMRH